MVLAAIAWWFKYHRQSSPGTTTATNSSGDAEPSPRQAGDAPPFSGQKKQELSEPRAELEARRMAKHEWSDFHPSFLEPWFGANNNSEELDFRADVKDEEQIDDLLDMNPYSLIVQFLYSPWPILFGGHYKDAATNDSYLTRYYLHSFKIGEGIEKLRKRKDPRVDERLLRRFAARSFVISKINKLIRTNNLHYNVSVQAYHQWIYWLTCFPEQMWPNDEQLMQFLQRVSFHPPFDHKEFKEMETKLMNTTYA